MAGNIQSRSSAPITGDGTFDRFQCIYPGTSQKRTVSSSSAQSSAVGDNTSIVRLHATTDCFVAFGTNPTAVADTGGVFMKADTSEYFMITPGDKIAVIRSSADGNLYITEGSKVSE